MSSQWIQVKRTSRTSREIEALLGYFFTLIYFWKIYKLVILFWVIQCRLSVSLRSQHKITCVALTFWLHDALKICRFNQLYLCDESILHTWLIVPPTGYILVLHLILLLWSENASCVSSDGNPALKMFDLFQIKSITSYIW